jgi:hypothetical protein
MRFDVFPKVVESSLHVRTEFGGLLAIFSIIAVILGTISEFRIWYRPQLSSELILGEYTRRAQIAINIKIDFLNNCSNLHEQLLNYKATSEMDGEVVRIERQSKDVCKLRFEIKAPMVPGCFRIALTDPRMPDKPPIWALIDEKNLSHRITLLTFGDVRRPTPIDKNEIIIYKENPYLHTYTLNLIPEIDEENRFGCNVVPFYSRANLNRMSLKDFPGVLFRWKYSPVSLKKELKREPIINFICHVLALAGIFFVFVRFADSFVFAVSCR